MQAGETALVPRGAIVFGFQQLALVPALLDAAFASDASCIAYETVEDRAGRLAAPAQMARDTERACTPYRCQGTP